MVKNDGNNTTHDARSRLVLAALRLFAQKGYEGATTREICEAADANISAIRYYFGDKAGLYRAAFNEPLGEKCCQVDMETYGALPLAEALNRFFKEFLEPLKMGEDINLLMKLRFREMTEPTGVWQQEIDAEIKPQHMALANLLKQHLRLPGIDPDLHRLTFAVIGMAIHFYVGQEAITSISPDMLNNAAAIDTLAERLAGFATAMVAAEAQRREREQHETL
ncbi:MAG: CerR family C-terminal domain-containing protein [Methylococcales bacterium]|nr:CerR family C-terminal domain-containing protein [Methylococcales bacterium]